MKTQSIEKFEPTNDESLSQVNGGFWGSLFAGFAQAYDGGVTLD